jgi:hypothetical protein
MTRIGASLLVRVLGRLLVPVFSAVACVPPATPSTCPAPFASDPAREARLVALVASDEEAQSSMRGMPSACFGPTRSPGVLVDGRPMLDARASDSELAARLAHLAVHVHDDLGDGCLRGRDAAIASEERARAIETRLRARAGLGPAPDEARESIADYAARCDRR